MLSKLLRVFALLGSLMLSDYALAKELNIVTTSFPQYDFVNHKVYGEAQALLAGDTLLTYAFEVLSSNEYVI